MKIVSIALALLVAGCALDNVPAPSAEPVQKPAVTTKVCPTADRTWTDAQLHDLKIALAPLADSSVIIKMAIEWNRLRVDSIACSKAAP